MLSLLGMWHHGSIPRVAFFSSVWKRTKSCTACRSVFCKRCLKVKQKEVYDISYVLPVNPRTTSKAPSTWSSSSTSDAAGFGSREALGLCSARQGSFPGGWSSAEGRWASRPFARRGSGTHAKDHHHIHPTTNTLKCVHRASQGKNTCHMRSTPRLTYLG